MRLSRVVVGRQDFSQETSVQQDSLLFRQEALDAQKMPSLGTIRLATPVPHQVWALTTGGIALSGQTVAAGQSLLAIMPQGSLLQAQLLVPS
jgi:hypothetical protein